LTPLAGSSVTVGLRDVTVAYRVRSSPTSPSTRAPRETPTPGC